VILLNTFTFIVSLATVALQFLEMGTYRHYKHGTPIVATPRVPGIDNSHVHSSIAVHDTAATTDATSQVELAYHTSQKSTSRNPSPEGWPTQGSTVHTICTSNGSPYTNFQNRIMYATYKMAHKAPGGEILAGFTRILHRTVEDELMEVC
jgi:hypothetical protein